MWPGHASSKSLFFFKAERVEQVRRLQNIFADIVVAKWEDKVQRDDGKWLVGLLTPVIDTVTDTILDNAPDVIIRAMKQELLSNQGSLTRIGNAPTDDIGITGLQYIETLLKDRESKVRPRPILYVGKIIYVKMLSDIVPLLPDHRNQSLS